MRIATLSLLTILCLALSAPAFADMYNNGPTNGGVNGWFIGQGQSYVVSDSFTGNGQNISGFVFAAWVTAGSTPTTVDWAIGTSSFGGDVGSGTADISTSPIFCHASGSCGLGFYDVYNATVTGLNLPTTNGSTYWLTLTNANDSFGGRVAWDINSGPSQAYHNLLGAVPSESFTISGIETCSGGATSGCGTPEPTTIMLFGSGILAIAGKVRGKLNP